MVHGQKKHQIRNVSVRKINVETHELNGNGVGGGTLIHTI
jgi:hypothetical protein